MYTTPPPAIFFDFDGVILESASIKTDAFVEMFQHLPQVDAIVEFHMNHMGVSRFKKFEWIYRNILNKDITQAELDQLGEQFSEIVFRKILEAPYVTGALTLLEKAKGSCLTFIASGTPQEELERIVTLRNLSSYFTEVCGTPRTKSEIVVEMVSRYKLNASQCWFIGDANTDYDAAVSNNMKFIARLTPEMSAFWQERNGFWKVNTMQEVADSWR